LQLHRGHLFYLALSELVWEQLALLPHLQLHRDNLLYLALSDLVWEAEFLLQCLVPQWLQLHLLPQEQEPV
jgi:hypothetical protein